MSANELTRWPDSTWPRLERGDWVRVTRGDWSGDFRVTDITPSDGGSETYHLEPADNQVDPVDAKPRTWQVGDVVPMRDLIPRAPRCRCSVLPAD